MRELQEVVDAWHVRARTAAWYSERLARTKFLPDLPEWRGDPKPTPSKAEWDRLAAEHAELVRRTNGR